MANSGRTHVAVLVVALLFPTLVTWVYFILLADCSAILQQVAYAGGKAVQFGLPVWWVFVRQRQRPQLVWPSTSSLFTGLVYGILVLAAMMALYHGLLKPAGILEQPAEKVREKVVGFGVDSGAKYVALAGFYALAHSFLEEYYWRWFVFGQLSTHMTTPRAIFLSSAGFMLHHILVLSMYFGWMSMATVLFSLAVGIGGAFWAWLYQRSGSLAGPWLSHAIVDLSIFIVGFDMVRETIRSLPTP